MYLNSLKQDPGYQNYRKWVGVYLLLLLAGLGNKFKESLQAGCLAAI